MQPQRPPRVRIVDDDAAVRESIARLLRAAGFSVATFSSAPVFLREDALADPGCVVLELSVSGQTGLDLQYELAGRDYPIPIVFVSGHGDVHSSVRAMKAGAVDFLTKPFEADALVSAVRSALERDGALRAARAERDSLSRRLATLTPREREVLACLVEGKLNKQIAAQLGAAEKTIKVHRARVLQKMATRSIVVLARMTERTGLQIKEN